MDEESLWREAGYEKKGEVKTENPTEVNERLNRQRACCITTAVIMGASLQCCARAYLIIMVGNPWTEPTLEFVMPHPGSFDFLEIIN